MIVEKTNAIIKRDPISEYHANKEFIGSSGLKQYLVSPLHAKFSRETEKEATPSMVFGSAYHCLILTPELFPLEYFVLNTEERPDKSKTMAANENKAWKEAVLIANAGRQQIDFEDLQQMEEMKKALQSNETAWFLLTRGEKEVSHYVNYNDSKVKIRPDNLNPKFISDLKTCEDASPDGFSKTCFNFGYDISAALYSDVEAYVSERETPLPFNFIAQEKKAPYAVAVYLASDRFIAHGRNRYLNAMELHQEAIKTGVFRGYEINSINARGIMEIDLPNWAYNK